ncbi:MerR family transcriptional regulator [Atopomonas sediminilitoris]|uniref:MerR family transcriptional regulator n=1 Tax=Atopomonas sediminilitoris TaxID=2919919 RepID=UPI001F4D7C6A|nr:MerR family transcriptional regulator [Atopomonas sediminilitoris]MCJ8170230.1 MerR family transcriptional regulator [Atopomonas sediminilitoris]
MLISELAKATGTTKDTLRHYDQLGLLLSGERQAGSRRYKDFSQDNIERIELIRLAKYIGFTLAEIAEQMRRYDAGGLGLAEQRAMLEARLAEVRERVRQAQEVERYLLNKIARLNSGELVEAASCLTLHQQLSAAQA